MALETSEQILYDHSFLLNPKLFPSCFGERNWIIKCSILWWLEIVGKQNAKFSGMTTSEMEDIRSVVLSKFTGGNC